VPKAVGTDPVGRRNAGSPGQATDELVGDRVAEPFGAVDVEEQRPGGALGDVVLESAQHDGVEGLGGGLAALGHDAQHPMAALIREGFDVAGEHLGDAQAVVDEEAHERGRAWSVGLGGRKEAIEFFGGKADRRGVA
jgi:hypothetical protein